jgi:glycosyltransferase involved in cell wall biosynthesis
MRILIVASNISPHMGGEAVLPWHYIRELAARGHEVHAATHARVRETLLTGPLAGAATYHFVEDSFLEKLFHRLGQIAPAALRDAVFNTLVAFVTLSRLGAKTRELAAAYDFDVIHQPTPVSPLFPSFTYGVSAPVVIGPMNGGMSFPPAFRREYSKGADAFVNLGRAFGGLLNRIAPGKRKASKILAANERTRNALPKTISASSIQMLVDNGVDLSLWTPSKSSRPAPPVFVFVGRLILLKGADMLIEAFGNVENDARLVIIGDGPEKTRLETLATEHAPGRVAFTGFLSQPEIRDRLAESTALILPSLRDCGGAVILEAFACGAPAIAVDWGGPQDYVTPETGILIEPRSRDYVVNELATSMTALVADRARAETMGRRARDHVEAHYGWAAKADAIEAVYRDVCAKTDRKN